MDTRLKIVSVSGKRSMHYSLVKEFTLDRSVAVISFLSRDVVSLPLRFCILYVCS